MGHSFSGDLTREVIGGFFDVYNALPRGLLESAYAGALYAELRALGLPIEREVPLEVHYRGEPVGWYRADLIIGRRLILELKTVPKLGDGRNASSTITSGSPAPPWASS